ncbi:MAG: arginine decarboxylase, partial [Oscillospiraceae bacterium]
MSYTPINDFVNEYRNKNFSRFHMPGHKGVCLHGMEPLDITEIKGADYLYDAEGIIGESERLTSRLFGTQKTLYSTEGSSLSIKAMLAVIVLCRKDTAQKPYIIASRNVHKAFIDGCCLLDIDVDWVYAEKSGGLCSSLVTADEIEDAIRNAKRKPDGIYVTSPDYLGNILDIESIAGVCRRYGIPLAVDNAHGAYLKFLKKSRHPMDLGADLCSDSAHKTLPVYTGGSYLHISKNAPKEFADCAKSAMSLFAS